MSLARMAGRDSDAGQVVVDYTLLVVSQGVNMYFKRPVFPVPSRLSTSIRQQLEELNKMIRTLGLDPARQWK